MNIIKVPISQVVLWEKNPRGITQKDYARLKKQILRLGVYKPLVCYQEGGQFVVLGGNMRLRALRDLGVQEVELSLIQPADEAQKIEYALSDNDRAGFTDEEKLAELVIPEMAKIELEDFKVDLGETLDLRHIIERFGPDTDKEAKKPPELPAVPEDKKQFVAGFDHILVEFSGGKDSMLALLWARKVCRELNKEFMALFVETGAEFPDLSSFVTRTCLDLEVNLVRLQAKQNIVEYYTRKGQWPDSIHRDCMFRFIVDVMKAYKPGPLEKTLKIRGGRPDQKTLKTVKAAYTVTSEGEHLFSPFYEEDKEAYAALLDEIRGILWPGYARGFLRTACWMCPFQRKDQWEALRESYPLLWEEMRILVKRLKYTHHAGDSQYRSFWNYWGKAK